MTPPIAVITTCYNDAAFVCEMLESVQASTIPDYEHVCVDNGSHDASGAIMDDYAAQDSRIRVIHLAENIGLAGGMNVAVASIRAPWLLKLDADDRIRPAYLELILDVVRKQPYVNCIFSPALMFGHGYEMPVTYRYPPFNGARMIDHFMVPGPSAWPLALWIALGGLDERMETGEDWDFAVRADRLVGLRCAQLANAEFEYRQHAAERMHDIGMRSIDALKAHLRVHTRASAVLDPVALGFRSVAYAGVAA